MKTFFKDMETANRKYKYDQVFISQTLDEWIQQAHRYNCQSNKWKYTPLKRGAYGYDNLAICLGNILTYIENHGMSELNVTKLASNVHDGWTENYIYWRDYTPFVHGVYLKPYNPINDERRNACASMTYEQLSDEEKEKDLIIARFIFEKIEDC